MSDFICRASSFVLPSVDCSIYRGCHAAKDEATVDQKQGKRTKQWPIELSLTWWATAKRSPNLSWLLRPASPQGWLYWFTQQFAFVFVWEVWGYDPMLVEREAQQALDAQALTFRRLTRNVLVTFEHSSTSDDSDYQQHLDRLRQTTNPLAKALIYSQKAKVRDLRHRGALQAKRTRIFVRYQLPPPMTLRAASRRGRWGSSIAPL